MKSNWIITLLVCAVFPALIPVVLIMLAVLCVSAAKKATPSDELGAD